MARRCGSPEAEGLTFVHPFDDPEIMAGQGTVALELLADAPEIDTLVVPIGGGGLISGVATAAKALRPDIDDRRSPGRALPEHVLPDQRQGHAVRRRHARRGHRRQEAGPAHARGSSSGVVDEILLVHEREIETAVSLYLQIEKTVAEGAGAAGLAALLAHPDRFRGRNVGLILTGGNIDTRLLATVLLRDLARSGRMARLRIQLQDRPGALLAVMKLFDRHGANIIEIYHQRVFTTLPAKDAFIDVECEARDAEHLEALVRALEEAGFYVHPVEIR